MDTNSRNVLQFVSVTAQIIETQSVDDLKGSTHDSRHSTDGVLTNSNTWYIPESINESYEENNEIKSDKPEQIPKLLAEAMELEIEDLNDNFAVKSNSIDEKLSSTVSSLSSSQTIENGLKNVFSFEKKEVLYGEWPCYNVQSVFVKGYMFLTSNHICFYALLPENRSAFSKSGYLLIKSGKIKTNYEKYYFDLKDGVLTWFKTLKDSYSPLGIIDLKDITTILKSKKRENGFKIITSNKKWHLKADSNVSQKEWIDTLQKALIKAKNTGSSLKILLPFDSIIDIELTEPFEFQKFLKIKAADIEDSFVMDEYYFAYFTDIENTFEKLKSRLNELNKSNKLNENSTSLSDLYDHKPISTLLNQSDIKNDLIKPVNLKDYLYQSTSFNNSTIKSTIIDYKQTDSDSLNDDDKSKNWLDNKRKSGMQLVFNLLGGNTTTLNSSNFIQFDQDDDDSILSNKLTNSRGDEAEILDERTMINFQKYFVLPESEKLLAVYRCSLLKGVPCYGKLYISTNHISFNARLVTKAKMIIPFQDVIGFQKISNYMSYSLTILTQAKKEIHIEFKSISKRNHCYATLYVLKRNYLDPSIEPNKAEMLIRSREAKLMEDGMKEGGNHIIPEDTALPVLSHLQNNPKIFKKPEKSLHFTCITIGTRGDVQPYIALCKGLMKDGHRCRIATHDEFKDWIEEHGIEFKSVGGDPGELMRICVENNFFSVNFVVEGLRLFKDWIDELLELTWKAVEGTDVIIESPSAMVGIHMAEALKVPYFRAFPMPMTRTGSFPHPFATPNSPKGSFYNNMTYLLFDHAIWRAIASTTNHFRKTTLNLPSTNYDNLIVHEIPYLYCFSTSIVDAPKDWKDWIRCTGYWFLDNPQTGWQPDLELKSFMEARDPRPIVYIGFGSIIISNPYEITKVIVDAVLSSNVRAIVSQGWSSRLTTQHQKEDILKKYPGTILSVQSVPHDWLFPQLRAVVHHGGAGTTAAGLRAGRPTIIKPFFADQFFWGERIQEMGLGTCIKNLTAETLSVALLKVSTDENMLKKAIDVGEKIKSENGVNEAIDCVYKYMDLARERTKASIKKTSKLEEPEERIMSFIEKNLKSEELESSSDEEQSDSNGTEDWTMVLQPKDKII